MTQFKTLEEAGITVSGSGQVTTTCPQCSHTRKKKNVKCLNVNTDDGVWFCSHCEWKGGLAKERDETVRNFRKKAKPVVPPVKDNQTLSDKSRAYLNGRGITDEVLKAYEITDGMEWMPQTEKEENCIRFPYHMPGRVANIKFRDGNKNFKMVKGAERTLYGYMSIDPNFDLAWAEGEVDKLSLDVAGIHSVSVPNGAADKLEFLESCEDRLKDIRCHVLAIDNDEPGKKLEAELIRRLGATKCKVVTWPEDCKDANDVLVKHGGDALWSAIENAKHVPVKGLYNVKDIVEDVIKYYELGDQRGVMTGWRGLDDIYSVRPGEWTLITGIPSHGKSEFLDALLVNLAYEEEWNIGVCSPENQPLERHAAKLIEKHSGQSFGGPKEQKIPYPSLMRSVGWLDDHFSFVLPDEDDLTVEGVLELAKTLVFRKGIKALVIDPWNELDHSRPREMSETEYISQALTKVRRFAREYQVHVFLVAHPTKIQKTAKGDYGVPRPYDISGSAHWYNKADNCITVWRDLKAADTSPVDIHVQKVRFKGVGKVGCATLYYEIRTGRYHDMKLRT